MKARSVSLFVILSISILFSCSKDENSTSGSSSELKTAELTAVRLQSDLLYDDVSLEVLQVNLDNTTPTTTSSACATITVSPQDLNTWPKTVTIDYGTTGCTGINGFVRKGKISYTISKRVREAGATVTVNFDNYSVNGYKLEGVYTITNNGSSDANLNITTQLVNGKLTYPDGKWYTRSSTINWVQKAGSATPLNPLDDEFSITGNATIRSSENNELITSTKTALTRKLSCANIVSGQLNVIYNGIEGLLDFGAGGCDKDAVLTVGTGSYTITLP
jgi:hypothetical protein